MSRLEVVALPLAPHVRNRLLATGFTHVSDLETADGPLGLARETGLTPAEAYEVLALLPYLKTPDQQPQRAADWRTDTVSAADLLVAAQAAPRIVTMCREMDEMLGGGVATGQITEFCGVPGVGKTQLGMQLAVNVQIPAALAGANGTAVYVDTEGSFMPERCSDIAEGAVRHITAVANKHASAGRPELLNALSNGAMKFDVDSLLRGITLFRILDFTELLSLVIMLPQLLQHQPRIRLIVIDSVSAPFRTDFPDMGARTRALTSMAQQLIAAAQQHGVAVVLTNQVTTRIREDGSSKLVPALGESWAHAASSRVMLHWGPHNLERHAALVKSPGLPPGEVMFTITGDGVRGMPPAGGGRGG